MFGKKMIITDPVSPKKIVRDGVFTQCMNSLKIAI
jgi:hypothetical protein